MMRILLVCLIALVATPALAISDQFIVSVSGGVDITPPTTPVLVSTTPASDTQIDIVWSIASDDVAVAGYVVLRDSVAIATTTQTVFSDTGLLASTTYSYAVYAFDHVFNLSTTSNSLSTTTLATPVVIEEDAESNGSIPRFVRADSLTITPSVTSALFYFEPNIPARYVLRFGTTDSYDDGYITNTTYRRTHTTTVTGLTPDTLYYYELIPYNTQGRAMKSLTGTFTTNTFESESVPNVISFTANPAGQEALLFWEMPSTLPTSVVRVVRNYRGYPTDPSDGAVLFEGSANAFRDSEAFVEYRTQYYAIFTISPEGRFSSGALAFASADVVPSTNPVDAENIATTTLPEKPEDIVIPDTDFNLEEITLYQGPTAYAFDVPGIVLSYLDPFLVSIPKEALPPHLKVIVATLLDPTDYSKSYSFLLRLNNTQTAYEALLAPVGLQGVSRLTLEIYDLKRQVVGRYSSQVDFVMPQEGLAEQSTLPLLNSFSSLWWPVVFILFCFVTYRLYRRSHPL